MTTSGPVLVVMALRVEMTQLPPSVLRGPSGVGPREGRTPQIVAERCGIGLESAACATAAAIERWHPRAVVVAGIAGGLQLDLPSGAVAVLNSIRSPHDELQASGQLSDTVEAALHRAGVACRRGPGRSVAGIANVATKRNLGANGALTVDSESHAVFRSAAARTIPSVALRTVADPSSRDVPRSIGALAGLEGAPWWPQILDLWRLPLELRAIIRFRGDLHCALTGLHEALPPALEALART